MIVCLAMAGCTFPTAAPASRDIESNQSGADIAQDVPATQTIEAVPAPPAAANATSPSSSSTTTGPAPTTASTPANSTTKPDPNGVPTPQVGDHWSVKGAETQGGVDTVEWTTKKVFKGPETIPLGSGTVKALRFETTLDYKDNSNWHVVATTNDWLRPEDQAMIKSVEQSHATRFGSPDRWFNQTTTYDSPCVQMKWPIKEGAVWETHCTAKAQGPSGTTTKKVDEAWTVGKLETITVQAGAFSAFHVQVKDLDKGSQRDQWFASRACDLVRLTTPNPSGDPPTAQLTDFSCAKEHSP